MRQNHLGLQSRSSSAEHEPDQCRSLGLDYSSTFCEDAALDDLFGLSGYIGDGDEVGFEDFGVSGLEGVVEGVGGSVDVDWLGLNVNGENGNWISPANVRSIFDDLGSTSFDTITPDISFSERADFESPQSLQISRSSADESGLRDENENMTNLLQDLSEG